MGDQRFVDAPPDGADGWREVWRDDRRYRPAGSLQALLEKALSRGTAADRDRQRDFNVALLDLLHDVRADIEAVRRDLRGDIEAVQLDSRTADEALAAEVRRVRELVPVAAERNDALIAALDQKIETLAVRLRDVTNPIVHAPAAPSQQPDFLYRRLEDALRGSESEIREALRPYVDHARNAQPVIDIGCGRGEFLAMCRSEGIAARGFDTNERSVAELQRQGIDVAIAGVPECFRDIEPGSAGSILATHVVEHLPVDALFSLFREAARVLRSGGLLMIETPNAESLLVGATEFWRDPTHLAPRHPAALVVLGREHGFTVDEVSAVHPFPPGTALEVDADDPPAVQRIVRAINERLFAPQDLRVILRKS